MTRAYQQFREESFVIAIDESLFAKFAPHDETPPVIPTVAPTATVPRVLCELPSVLGALSRIQKRQLVLAGMLELFDGHVQGTEMPPLATLDL